MKTHAFKKIFEPFKTGNLTFKNRIVMSPMVVSLCSMTGEVTPRVIDYYGARAKGGVAMIIVEAASVDGSRTFSGPQLRIDKPGYIAGLNNLVKNAIHANNALACIQLHHMGMWGPDPVGPSNVACTELGLFEIMPRPLTTEEILEIREQFSEGALRARIAGFDMVELHGGTSYLLQQFVSPHTNLRTDEYGGSIENRMRLPLEIIRDIKRKCGPDFPVGYRMVADELLPDGITFEECKIFAKKLEQEGAAYLSVQLGTYETFNAGEGTMAMRSAKGNTNSYTHVLKKTVSLPVFACQQNHEPEAMEEILEKGVADIIALGRPLIVDPEFTDKVRKNRQDDIRRCIRCGNCYDCITMKFSQVSCPQNPSMGREREYELSPSAIKRNVLVIGGGPAGLEAARVAALRGHDVTLIEKENELGGQLRFAALPMGKQDIKTHVTDWLERQCRKAGVKIVLNKTVTPELVRKMNPDVVIAATGASPAAPFFPVSGNAHVVPAVDVLSGRVTAGTRVVVMGGNAVGVETADFLAEKGLAEHVSIVEMLPRIASDMENTNRSYVLEKLGQFGVDIFTGLKIVEVKDNEIIAVDRQCQKQSIGGDTFVMAMGVVSNTALIDGLEAEVQELYVIGDCRKPRKILEAIHEGAHVGRMI